MTYVALTQASMIDVLAAHALPAPPDVAQTRWTPSRAASLDTLTSRPPCDTGVTYYDSRQRPASWADERLAEIRREHAERQAQFDRDRMRDAWYCPAPSQSPAWGPIAMERRIEWTLALMRGPGISPPEPE